MVEACRSQQSGWSRRFRTNEVGQAAAHACRQDQFGHGTQNAGYGRCPGERSELWRRRLHRLPHHHGVDARVAYVQANAERQRRLAILFDSRDPLGVKLSDECIRFVYMPMHASWLNQIDEFASGEPRRSSIRQLPCTESEHNRFVWLAAVFRGIAHSINSTTGRCAVGGAV